MNRKRQKHNRRVKEEMHNLRDMGEVKYPAPYEVVKEIIKEFKHKNKNELKGSHISLHR